MATNCDARRAALQSLRSAGNDLRNVYDADRTLTRVEFLSISKRSAILTSHIVSAMSSMRFLTPKRCGVNWLNWPKEKINTELQSAFARLLKCDRSGFHIIFQRIYNYPNS
jgi:hypothetical protein